MMVGWLGIGMFGCLGVWVELSALQDLITPPFFFAFAKYPKT